MWKSFLQAIALLAVALLTALYSTSTAHAGNMVTTIAAALLSLAIAAWVGIRFVPRLARGVDWDWLPILTAYKVTREGSIFLGALLVVVAAAVNTNNNLLYMVLSALLGVLVLSGLMSAMNFRFIEMELLLPARAYSGETLPLSVRVRNTRRFFPAFSLLMETPGDELYFSVIHPRGTSQLSGNTRFDRRGRHVFKRLKAASRFPFGFFQRARAYPIKAECVCYPEILPQDQLKISVTDILGKHQRLERGPGNDLHTIRNYLPSDSARHVHWKATAKTASLKTREFATEESRRVVLLFDRYARPRDAEPFEELVKRAASLAFHLIRSGVEVTLITDEWESPTGNTEATLEAILNYLALVEKTVMTSPPAFDPQSPAVRLSLRADEVQP